MGSGSLAETQTLSLPSAGLSARSWAPDIEASVRASTTTPLALLRASDLRRSADLRVQLSDLQLNAYFDSHGGPRFRRLGLSFAAKQHAQVGATFGSTGQDTPTHSKVESIDEDSSPESLKGHRLALKVRSADTAERAPPPPRRVSQVRQYLNAESAKKRDSQMARRQTRMLLRTAAEAEQVRVADVRERQLRQLFAELPLSVSIMALLPPGVSLANLLPPDPAPEQEQRNFFLTERMNGNVHDRYWTEGQGMGWLFGTREEAIQIATTLERWTRAHLGTHCPWGIDRSTFCRFILETGLYDSRKAPFHWTISMFDSVAVPMRCSPTGSLSAPTAPYCYIANRWNILSVLDIVLRQLFELKSKRRCLEQIAHFAKRNLPQAVLSEDLTPLGLGGPVEIEESEPETPLESPPFPSLLPILPPPPKRSLKKPKPSYRRRISDGSSVRSSVGSVRFRASMTASVASSEASSSVNTPQEESRAEGQEEESVVAQPPTILVREQRDRHAIAMLLEPEVLHMTVTYSELFRQVHGCYANSEGHMTFTALLQFCQDFCMTPEISSIDGLRTLYDTAKCVEVSATALASLNAAAAARAALNASPRSASRTPRPHHRGHSERCHSRSHHHEVQMIFGPHAFQETLLRASFLYLGNYGNPVQQSTSAFCRVVWLLVRLRYVAQHFLEDWRKKQEAGRAVLALDEPFAKALEILHQNPPPPPKREKDSSSTVGPDWTLLQPAPHYDVKEITRKKKVTAMTMETGPKLRPGVTTADAVRRHLHKRVRTSAYHHHIQAMAAAAALCSKMNFAAKKVDPQTDSDSGSEEWDGGSGTDSDTEERRPPMPMGQMLAHHLPLWGLGIQAGVKSDDNHDPVPLEDLFEIEGGKPCIVDGVCNLCSRRIPEGQEAGKGNPFCRGCSVVDFLDFRYHPFAVLLLGRQPLIDPALTVEEKSPTSGKSPIAAQRPKLVPPPFLTPEMPSFLVEQVASSPSLDG